MGNITNKKILSNVVISITAQIISLMTSFVVTLILPKYIPELQYSYWQTYILYASYVGLLHFGVLDGMILRYSKYDFEELDKKSLRSQFQLLIGILSIITILVIITSILYLKEPYKDLVLFISSAILLKNWYTYILYIFQITNQIKKYAFFTILNRSLFFVLVVGLLWLNYESYIYYIIADIVATIICILYGILLTKEVNFGSFLNARDLFNEFKLTLLSGIMIMIANFSANFILGFAKMIIQWKWGFIVFGKLSFSFSLTNIFFTFIIAVSIVIFPSLKRIDQGKLPYLYVQIDNLISIFLYICLLLYFPLAIIVIEWLPNYSISIFYLGLIFPIIVFSSKVSLYINNYYKTYRQEKLLMIINVLSVIFAIILYIITAYYYENLISLLMSLLVIIFLRYAFSDYFIRKFIKLPNNNSIILELIMSVIFVITAYFELHSLLILYLVLLIIYIYNKKDSIKKIIRIKIKK